MKNKISLFLRQYGKWVLTGCSVILGGWAARLVYEGNWVRGVPLALIVALYNYSVEFGLPQLILRRSRAYAGVRFVVPVQPLDEHSRVRNDLVLRRQEAGQKAFCAAVDKAKRLDLIVASGFKVIGCDHDPGWLYETLGRKDPEFHLRVLVLDPDCPASRKRAAEVLPPKYGWSTYQAGTRAVLWTLGEWSQKFRVDVRTYKDEPVWQMAVMPRELWLLVATRAAPGDSTKCIATHTSPIYVLERDTQHGLAWGLEATWAKTYSKSTKWDFSGQVAPDWQQIVKI